MTVSRREATRRIQEAAGFGRPRTLREWYDRHRQEFENFAKWTDENGKILGWKKNDSEIFDKLLALYDKHQGVELQTEIQILKEQVLSHWYRYEITEKEFDELAELAKPQDPQKA